MGDLREAFDKLVPLGGGGSESRIVEELSRDPLDVRCLEYEDHLVGGQIHGMTLQPESLRVERRPLAEELLDLVSCSRDQVSDDDQLTHGPVSVDGRHDSNIGSCPQSRCGFSATSALPGPNDLVVAVVVLDRSLLRLDDARRRGWESSPRAQLPDRIAARRGVAK